jgi:MFS family permease
MKPLPRSASLLLNAAHAMDHMFLLIFATSVGAIAADFGFAHWEDLMPYSVGAFAMFGIGSLPAGRLGDHWGRRRMMIVFFFGMGAGALLVAMSHSSWQLALALAFMGVFSSIYHPVGIPMLVQRADRPGLTIGVNGLAGNLGVALSALVTGALVKYVGWRAAFVVPALVAIACGIAFARVAPHEAVVPARRAPSRPMLDRRSLTHIFTIVTVASISASLIFNFTTNGNGELLRERMRGIVEDPAALGLAQVSVGLMLDRVSLKTLYAGIVVVQAPLFLLAANANGWALYAFLFAFMIAVFGAIPFTDAMIVRYVDDRMRSRVSGMRFAVAFGVSSLAVWLLGPLVKSSGFRTLLLVMAATAFVTFCVVLLLPRSRTKGLGADEASPAAAD